jgi:hypothetical protein
MNTDPNEFTNLYDDPGQQDRIRDYTDRLREWQAGCEDNFPL